MIKRPLKEACFHYDIVKACFDFEINGYVDENVLNFIKKELDFPDYYSMFDIIKDINRENFFRSYERILNTIEKDSL